MASSVALYMLRDANHIADWLASHAYAYPIDLVYFDNAPPDCLHILWRTFLELLATERACCRENTKLFDSHKQSLLMR
ncbi:hypothetical protein SADUNF_Sadunf19G0065600 [Salix dunnii]|uniref:Uncharacterized protein n=1 Tax=Salix dunnii TaxID=1413687 RepID=A0A835J0T5_9ROSI|nr:hypothetical protein SADUNF_Sadunf19G0065600 [Salix dunnii]